MIRTRARSAGHLRALLVGAAAVALLGLAPVGCLPQAQLGQTCAEAMRALDHDGDLYLTEQDPPDACDGSWEEALEQVAGEGYLAGDCDDGALDVHPGAEEICGDGIDQDCDGAQPEPSTRYDDADGDGYGDPGAASERCGAPAGTVDNADDCDDQDPTVNPDGVEAACADALDADCDGVTDCAVSGAMSATTWGAIASSDGPGEGAGLSMVAVPAGPVLIGGANGAWLLRGEGRALAHEALLIEGSSSAGSSVCLLDDLDGDDAPEVLVGDLAYDGGVGRLSVGYSSGDAGELTGSGDGQRVGAAIGAAAGLLAVPKFLEASWTIYLLPAEGLPVAGTSTKLSTLNFPDAIAVSAAGSAGEPPALSVAGRSGAWLVAVGQAENDAENLRVKIYSVSDDSASIVFYLRDSDDDTTLGASALLADITGDGSAELIVGAPGDTSLYVYADAAALNGTLTADDATFTITADTIPSFGAALAVVPDMNGDGVDDLLVGGDDNAALLLGGGAGPVLYATLSGADGFGGAIAGADLDGDGFGDLIIGAADASAIHVLWGGS